MDNSPQRTFKIPALEKKNRLWERNPNYGYETINQKPTIGDFFIDSGAHSLHNVYVRGKTAKERAKGYAKYDKPKFWLYVDRYAEFIKTYKDGIDYYANVDVIFDPARSWKVLKYLEEEHGLNPVPVIHHGTPLKWLQKHLDAGYEFIGIGGVAQQESRGNYYDWADSVFNMICDNKDRLPCVRTHGFAMTAYPLLIRYPWWSVDSVSWAKQAGFGGLFIPHKRKGEYTFAENPYSFQISHNSKQKSKYHGHFNDMPPKHKKLIVEWLEYIEMDLDEVQEWYPVRAKANLMFFQKLQEWLPEWPWPFNRSYRERYLAELYHA